MVLSRRWVFALRNRNFASDDVPLFLTFPFPLLWSSGGGFDLCCLCLGTKYSVLVLNISCLFCQSDAHGQLPDFLPFVTGKLPCRQKVAVVSFLNY